MSTGGSTYEQYLRDNWENLTPFQQEEGRAYLQSKFQSVAAVSAPPETVKKTPPEWTVGAGYACVIFVAIAGIGFGIYNAATGRVGHGITQIILSILAMSMIASVV